MQTDPESGVQKRLVGAIEAAARTMPLRNGGERGLHALRARAGKPRSSRTFKVLAAAAVVAILGSGAVAAAHELGRDPVSDDFTRLHPDKSDIDDVGVEPHALVAEVAMPDGTRSRLFRTTQEGSKACWDVQQIRADGEQLGNVGFCRAVSSPSLDTVNGVIVGFVPGEDVVSVRATANGQSLDAAVTLNSFLLSPSVASPGMSVTLQPVGSAGEPAAPVVVVVGPT